MSLLLEFLMIYITLINVITFFTFMADKIKAKRDRWRIKESTLMTMALAGGSAGALAGMYVFRHKTRTGKFKFGVPLILALQIVITVLIIYEGIPN